LVEQEWMISCSDNVIYRLNAAASVTGKKPTSFEIHFEYGHVLSGFPNSRSFLDNYPLRLLIPAVDPRLFAYKLANRNAVWILSYITRKFDVRITVNAASGV